MRTDYRDGIKILRLGASFFSFFWMTSQAFPGANVIPAECDGYAKHFLIKGDYQSSLPGDRQWDLAAIATVSSVSLTQANCIEIIWRQAHEDQQEYWEGFARRHHCVDSAADRDNASLPDEAPPGCSSSDWDAARSNYNWLKMSEGMWEQTLSNLMAGGDHCLRDPALESFAQAKATAKDVVAALQPVLGMGTLSEKGKANGASAPSASAQADSPPDLDTGLSEADLTGLNEAPPPPPGPAPQANQKSQADPGKCEGIPIQDRKAEYGGPKVGHDDFWHPSCLTDVLHGIVNNLSDTFNSAWDIAVALVKGVGKLSAAMVHFLEAACKEGIGAVAREYYQNSTAVIEKVKEYVVEGLEGIGATLLSKLSDLSCYNHQTQGRVACQMAGYLGPDVILFMVPGTQEFLVPQLEKIPSAAMALNVLKRAGRPVETAVEVAEGVGVGTRAVARIAGETLDAASAGRYGRIAAGVAKVIRVPVDAIEKLYLKASDFVQDSSSKVKMWVSTKLGRVFVLNKSGAIMEVTDTSLKAKILRAWAKVGNLYERMGVDARTAAAARKVNEAAADAKAHTRTLSEKAYPGASRTPGTGLSTVADRPILAEGLKMDAKQSADFLGFKPQPELPHGHEFPGQGYYTIKDSKKVEHEFERKLNPTNGEWWFEYVPDPAKYPKSKFPSELAARFPVYLDIPPANLKGMLPGVLEEGLKRGAFQFEVGASADMLKSGRRMTVWFSDAREAERFSNKMAPRLNFNECVHGGETLLGRLSQCITIGTIRHVVVGSVVRTVKGTATSAWVSTEMLVSACHQDPVCTCHVYLNEGINPEDHKPIEISKFGCDSAGNLFSIPADSPN